MTVEQDFHQAMLGIYERAGAEVGYWAKRYLGAVKRKTGLVYAKELLRVKRQQQVQSGFEALTDSGRSDISVEALVLRPEFIGLFNPAEVAEARRRLDAIPEHAIRRAVPPEQVHPETMLAGLPYTEGGARTVTVNAYERNSLARAACIAWHGVNCSVCGMNFKDVYGEIGDGFIHVHHKKPLATIREEYELDPVKDLAPVCPNCHAMLHRMAPALSIIELKTKIAAHKAQQKQF
jgi:5-methylcytosine-specific restriction protein A